MRQRKGSLGFTLLELLLVVIIVGILATVAIPQFGKMADRSREAEALTAIAAVLTAEMVYYQENNAFTTVALTVTPHPLLVDIPIMKSWGIPSFPTGVTITGLGTPNVVVLTDTAHGDVHQIRGGIDSTGRRVMQHKRPGASGFTDF